MSIRSKLLVDFGGKKYPLFVESDTKSVTFKRVFAEIQQQISENISQQTHWFEVYDKDFEEYVLVSNEEEVIENLSRIRINPKDTDEEPIETNRRSDDNDMTSIISPPIKSEINNIELKSFMEKIFVKREDNKSIKDIESDDNQSITSSVNETNNLNANSGVLKTLMAEKCKLFNDLVPKNIRAEEETDLSRDSMTESLIDGQSVISCSQASATTQSKSIRQPINYLEIEISDDYRLSPTCPHLYYSTVVEKFRRQQLVCIRFKISDYKGVQKLLDLMTINRKCFEINRLNDEISSPKWKVVSHQMVANGFEYWTPKKCKQAFICAINMYKKTLTTCPDFETAYKVNSLFEDLDYYDLKFLVPLREFNVIRDLRQSFGNTITEDLPLSHRKHKDLIFFKKKFGSNQSIASMPEFRSKATPNADHSSNLTKLKQIGHKFDDKAVKEFEELVASVKTVVAQFGHVTHSTTFWQRVSQQMKTRSYDMKGTHWWQLFSQYVCDYYAMTLTYSPDKNSAQQTYPLFRAIHSMDLSQSLSPFSYQKIKDLRQKFNQRCSKSGKVCDNVINNYNKTKAEIDKTKLRTVSSRIDSRAVKEFKALAKSVRIIADQFGSVEHLKHFWKLVANQMMAEGYADYDKIRCRQVFTENVNDIYALALTYSSEISADKYPLFETIHTMDLKDCLSATSFYKIDSLRQKFNDNK